MSAASTFDGSDANGLADVYVHHRGWLDTWRVSRALDDEDPDGEPDAFVRDLDRERTARWSLTGVDTQSTGAIAATLLSADASVLAFVSLGSDLGGGDTNAVADVFVRVPE